jgi:hypothetical protein
VTALRGGRELSAALLLGAEHRLARQLGKQVERTVMCDMLGELTVVQNLQRLSIVEGYLRQASNALLYPTYHIIMVPVQKCA